MIMINVCIFTNKPDQYFNILLAPIFFNSFIFDHSKIDKNDTFRF